MRKLPIDHYDIIYIDGAHNAPAVLEDAVLAFRLLKAGGVLIFDDYRFWATSPKMKSPRYAIDTFLKFFGDQVDVLHTGSQMILQRKGLDNKSIGLQLEDEQDDA